MKKNIAIILLVFLSINLYAERVDKNTAMKVAKTMVGDVDFNEVTTRSYSNLYIFSSDNSFVIVSADDKARPVIGYSNENPFVINGNNTNIDYWLNQINSEIQYAIDNDIEATEDIQKEWKTLVKGVKPEAKHRSAVDALLTTKWSQDEPYNNMCPGGSMTGCGATAMAMVMKYWNWPAQGVGANSYYENDFGNISVNFSATTYDWENMTDEYNYASTQVEKDAVATLMYHCGVSINMDYGLQASGAYPDDVKDALVDHFNYKSSINDHMKDYYSDYEWIALLKEELDAHRPILYNGWDIEGGGHSFVCDGYDENDYFHFNWGWGGYCDGHFVIGGLSPGIGGIGSGSGQYNETNYIIIGIEPNDNSASDVCEAPTNVEATAVNSTKVRLSWDEVENAVKYGVYVEGYSSPIGYTADLGAVISNLESGYEYCFTVTAVNANDEESEHSEEACVYLSEDEFIGPPTNIKVEATSLTSLRISWDAVEGALGYGIFHNNNYIGGTYDTFVDVEELEPYTEYCFQLISIIEVDDQNQITNYSDLSEVACGMTSDESVAEMSVSFNIYPNPVNDKLFIDAVDNVEEINIYTITGVKVDNLQCSTHNEQYAIDVNKLQSGIYIIEIKSNNNSIIKRFIKK